VLESQLLQGTWSPTKKARPPLWTNRFRAFHAYTGQRHDRPTTNADHLIQEMALKDWMRGGGSARDEAHEKIS
jgi:hypothetical protein